MQIIGVPDSYTRLCASLDVEPTKPEYGYLSAEDKVVEFLQDIVGDRSLTTDQHKLLTGTLGELTLAGGLEQVLRDRPGYLLHDIDLPFNDTCRRPDHILLTTEGIAVIESKYWRMSRHDPEHQTRCQQVSQQVEDGRKAVHMLLYKRTSHPGYPAIQGATIRVVPIVYNPTMCFFTSDMTKPGGVQIQVVHSPTAILSFQLPRSQQSYDESQLEEFQRILAAQPKFVPISMQEISEHWDFTEDNFPTIEEINRWENE